MYTLKIDNDENKHRFDSVKYAKKIADEWLELGAYKATIYRGNKEYAYRTFNTKWRNV